MSANPTVQPGAAVDAAICPLSETVDGASFAADARAGGIVPVSAAIPRPDAEGLYDPANEKDACGVGFIAHIKGQASHAIITDALEMLRNMDHRGACGCEPNTGDGAGILTGLPLGFLQKVAHRDLEVELPEPGSFAAGLVFLPQREDERAEARQMVEAVIAENGQKLIGWRPVPVDVEGADIGPTARAAEPAVEMLIVAAGAAEHGDREAFERKLYVIRKQAAHRIRHSALEQASTFYICSLSTKVIIYKGQLTAGQVDRYYLDLQDEDYTSHLAMVHSRFSTNTFPSWDRAQPMRFMSHNGEINTLQGNVNWMRAREGLLESELLGDDLARLLPVNEPGTSDSGGFDNVLELLLMAGRSLPEAVMMMIPEAWENHESMSMVRRAFYEYHACLMEPWDGPASIAFTDGHYIGAVLDRNGLRPSRYYITHDDRVIMASEVGVRPVEPSNVRNKGRLQPGRMFLVNFDEGRIVDDEEVKHRISTARPYAQWLAAQRIELADLAPADEPAGYQPDTLLPRLQAFGYTTEHMDIILRPMASGAQEPIGSMGNDAALAVLSDKPRLVYDYFKQRFAQVTNPPIDPIREEIIMSLECYIGPEGNLLDTTEAQCHRLLLPHPVLTNEQLAAIKQTDHRGWRAATIDMTYPAEGAGDGSMLRAALDRICDEASRAIEEGYQLIVLSDRHIGPDRIALSALPAVGAVHHHLVREAKRTRIGLIVESGEVREVHHFCLLVGYGADAINPYLAFEALWQMRRDEVIDPAIDDEQVVDNYIKAVRKGLLKVMSKMGISTLASYKGAQIFECIGLRDEVIDRCFRDTPSRLQGAGFRVLGAEAKRRHEIGYPSRKVVRLNVLPNPGEYHWRPGGEKHAINPTTIANMQHAVRRNEAETYWRFAEEVNDASRTLCTLRGLMDFQPPEGGAIPIEQVEPTAEIVKRFRTGAMSFGALSKEAHETLAIAMNRIGGRSNSGEGGEDYDRFTPDENGDWRRSSIKQVASGRFGVTSWYLTNADTIQIKVAQGAKPGEGGQLPGFKVDADIARVRHSTPGVGLISPPPHHDIYSIEDLAQLIFDLKNANPRAQVSVKLVAEVGVGTIAAGVAKAHADHILISGHDGGTGASPLTSIKHAGLPWELGLAETHQTLVLNDLRSRVNLETDGGLRTGRDVVIAALLGAEEYGFATTPLIAIGCIMMRKCHLNTCPVGICTQDPVLRAKFSGQPEHVINYFFMVAEEARRIMASLGIARIDDLVGRVDLLHASEAIRHWKADGIDLAPILMPARKPHPDVQVRKTIEQDHGLENVLDRELVKRSRDALDNHQPVRFSLPVHNTDRAVGAMLSHELSRRFGHEGLPDDTIHIDLQGSAGQSLGAWLAPGITIELAGDANDYVGKGLSGGRVIVYPPEGSAFEPSRNMIIGNVALYGAIEGEAYFRGMAAERFAVRNSGAWTVVEGVGDHGCEYMTGGRVVVLGPTGRNFAAGMSGGVAYVLDSEGDFLTRCNLGMVDLEKVDAEEDRRELRTLIERHHRDTGSDVAARILAAFDRYLMQFVKVMPIDYRRVLEQQKAAAVAGATTEPDDKVGQS